MHRSERSYLVKLDRSSRRPPHALIDERHQVYYLVHSTNVYLSNARQGLLRRVKMFEEDHDVLGCRLRLGRVRNHVKVKAKVHLTNCHLVADDIDG